jgi:hypothetical protein
VPSKWHLLACALGAPLLCLGTACSELASVEDTPVPGAAATAARADRTPIPTPVRTPTRPSGSPAPSAVAAPSPSRPPAVAGAGVTDEQVNHVRQQVDQVFAGADLPGFEGLLLDNVALATAEGGSLLDKAAAAAWLRDRSGAIQVTNVDRSTLAVAVQVETEGWQTSTAMPNGQITFNLHRYAANGQQDEDRGDWKIDVISAQ